MSGYDPGLNDADYQKLAEILTQNREFGPENPEGTSAAECAKWRARYDDGEFIKRDIAPSVDAPLRVVKWHVYGNCGHHGGSKR